MISYHVTHVFLVEKFPLSKTTHTCQPSNHPTTTPWRSFLSEASDSVIDSVDATGKGAGSTGESYFSEHRGTSWETTRFGHLGIFFRLIGFSYVFVGFHLMKYMATSYTLPGTNKSPLKKWSLGDYFPFGKAYFQVLTVSFREGIHFQGGYTLNIPKSVLLFTLESLNHGVPIQTQKHLNLLS